MSPACARAGAKRSGRVRHHKTFPRVRAAIPAAKSAAAAPSIAPWPPPATSCSAPSANPPPGRCRSIALMPKGSTNRWRLDAPSSRQMRARSSSIAGWEMGVFMALAAWRQSVPYLFLSSPESQSESAGRDGAQAESWTAAVNLQAMGTLPPDRISLAIQSFTRRLTIVPLQFHPKLERRSPMSAQPTQTPVCAVVGVGPGNGAAFARRFVAEGYAVALLARGTGLTSRLANELPMARAYACDVG